MKRENEIVVDYLTAQEIQGYHSQGMTSITVNSMPRLTDEAKDLLEKIDFQIVVKSPDNHERKPESPGSHPAAFRKRKPFRELLQAENKLLGMFIQIGHPVVTEFVGKLGFDFLVIDCEHSAMHIETIQLMLQSLAASTTYGIVRIPAIKTEYIARYLDAGADGIVIPQVRTREDIELIKNAAFYPPEGKRGIGPGRVYDFGLKLNDMQDDPNQNTAIIVQIETTEALENLDQIISTDFLDLFFIGPGDLSMNLGRYSDFTHPRLKKEICNIVKKAKANKKKAGIFAGDFKAAGQWLMDGLDMVVINSELGLMGQTIKSGLDQLKTSLENNQQRYN